MIYFIVLIILCIPVFKFDLLQQEKGRNLWFFFILIILILLSGLRYRVGGDTLLYIEYFEDYPTLSELYNFDFTTAMYNPLWYIYNAIIKTIYDNFIFFQIIQSIIVNGVFLYFFKKYTSYYFTAILLYYCGYYLYFNMEILREVLCICLFMISISYLLKKAFILYYLFCILALLIHFSSVIMLFIPLLLLIKKESFKWTIIISLVVFIFLSVVDVVPFLLSLFLEGQALLLAEQYFSEKISVGGIIFQFVQCSPLLLLLYIHSKNRINEDIFWGKMMMLCVIIYIFSMFLGGFFRLINYFVPFYILYLVNTFYTLIHDIKLKPLSNTFVSLVFLLYIFNFTYYYMQDKSEYMPGAKFYYIFSPYYSVFNPVRDDRREQFLENYRDLELNF